MNKNLLVERINSLEVTYGCWNAIAHSYVAEICASAGFDWILIDMEHAPYEINSVLHQLQAIDSHGVPAVVRPPGHDPIFIKQLLDIGVQNLVVPRVENAEETKQLVEALRYPPHGNRGVGTGTARAAQWGRIKDYPQHANEEMCLIVQVESLNAIENLDEILKIEGLNGAFVGPSDLSADMGYLGQGNHPEVVKVVNQALEKIRNSGKITGVFTLEKDVADEYQSHGANMIGMALDTLILVNGSSDLVREFRKEG